VNSAARFLSPSEAARRLGISTKALRLYEQRGLIAPGRTSAGWRAYGPAEIARATDIVELRALGLSLSEVVRILAGDAQTLDL
jgi:DNA-binding transcriptional MerR regulator